MATMRLYFECTTPPHNKFYLLTMQDSLFGTALIRRWGRIGRRGRYMLSFFEEDGEAERAFRALRRMRLRHGYHVAADEMPDAPQETGRRPRQPALFPHIRNEDPL
jgi:predicted DNA-binding WGR domain protein